MKNKKLIKKIVLIALAVIVLVGAVAGGAYYCKIQKAKKQTVAPINTNKEVTKIDTTNWQTYSNAQYNISLKYPNDWRVIDFQTELGMGTWDTFGFIPVAVKNQYCNIEQDVNDSIQNYKTNNPIAGYEKYSSDLDKVALCSIQVRVEKNPDNLSISDYLKKNYVPIVGNLPKDKVMKAMEEKINSLVVTKNNGIEESRSDYSFHKFVGGSGEYGDGYLATSVEDRSQVIINTRGNIIFITNHINAQKIVDQNQVTNLFESITQSFQQTAQNDLTDWKISIKNGDQVKSGTMYRSKVYIIATDKDNNQKTIYTFNDHATEKQEMEEVRFLNFDKENKKILIHYKKWHDICKTGTPENCSLWDYAQWLENGIYNINLVTGTLEKVFDFKNSPYGPQSIVYDSGSRFVLFAETNKNQDAINIYKINKDGTVGKVIPTITNTDTNWNLVYFPSFAYVEIMNGGNDLCFRSSGTEGSREWKYDFEGRPSGIYSAKCTKDNQDNINFNGNAIIGTEIQEIELGKL